MKCPTYGLLALMSALFFLHVYIQFPTTPDITAWYATGFPIDLVVALVLVFYGFYTSLAGQPLLRGRFLEES